jgi:hypothetical protein
MKTIHLKQEQRRFLIKSYRNLEQLKEVILELSNTTSVKPNMSVLGKLGQYCVVNNKETQLVKTELKHYFKGVLGAKTNFAIFCNPEIGTLFITGSLVSQFLNDMNGTVLGEMPSGPYGILRGLGITENNASKYLKDLNEKCFLLILRGYDQELKIIEELL